MIAAQSSSPRNATIDFSRIERRQVDQIIDVDSQRREIELSAGFAESFDVRWVRNPGAPHPGTRREDLKCVRAQPVCRNRRIFQEFRARRMNSDSQTAIVAGHSHAVRFAPYWRRYGVRVELVLRPVCG